MRRDEFEQESMGSGECNPAEQGLRGDFVSCAIWGKESKGSTLKETESTESTLESTGGEGVDSSGSMQRDELEQQSIGSGER
jgi:hypothetical protein